MFELYVIDTETSGLDPIKNDPIEISIYRLKTNEQKTWFLKPINMESIQSEALKKNKTKIEDIKGLTAEGREKYKDPKKIIVEIENWLMDDRVSAEDRAMVGQNISFDKEMLYRLWEKCGSLETFPFNKKYDFCTMRNQIAIDYATDKLGDSKGYSLNILTKKYGVVNKDAHSAEADVKATVELFRKQMDYLREKLNV